jgi:hypothetical protein
MPLVPKLDLARIFVVAMKVISVTESLVLKSMPVRVGHVPWMLSVQRQDQPNLVVVVKMDFKEMDLLALRSTLVIINHVLNTPCAHTLAQVLLLVSVILALKEMP